MTSNERRAVELLMNEDETPNKSCGWAFYGLMNALIQSGMYKPVPHSDEENIKKIFKGVE